MRKIIYSTLFSIFLSTSFLSLHSNETETKLNKLSTQIDDLKTEIFINKDEVELFNLNEVQGIGKINTIGGFLYVKIRNVTKVDKGYKAQVSIGNPLNAVFGEISLNFAWKSSNEWIKKKIEVQNKLEPSTWTVADVVLPINSTEELKDVFLSIDMGTIELIGK